MSERLLALDASSTTIGWVLLVDGRAVASGTAQLPPRVGIGARCGAAQAVLGRLWAQHGPTRLAVEGPAHHAPPLALIAQQRVMGALLAQAWERGLTVVEVPPATAKKALTGRGNADKAEMVAAAQAHMAGADEHAADALGVAFAAREVVRG